MPKPKFDLRFKWAVTRTLGGRFYGEWDTRVSPTRGYLKQHVEPVYTDRGPRDIQVLRFGKQNLWPTRRTLVVSTPMRVEGALARKRKYYRLSVDYMIRARNAFGPHVFRSSNFHQFFQDF